jgi:hypothetical protein
MPFFPTCPVRRAGSHDGGYAMSATGCRLDLTSVGRRRGPLAAAALALLLGLGPLGPAHA